MIQQEIWFFQYLISETKTRRIKKYCSSDNERNAGRNNRKNEIASQKENDNTDEDDTLHKENIAGPIHFICENRHNDIQRFRY